MIPYRLIFHKIGLGKPVFFLVLTYACLFSTPLRAQRLFQNPSFEGNIALHYPPVGWISCGEDSTPDTQPLSFNVNISAQEGKTFLGMVCRTNQTWEAVYGGLMIPLVPGSCYAFSLYLAYSATYADYRQQAILRIWGGHQECNRGELLWTSPTVSNTDWRSYPVVLKPRQVATFLLLEVYYANGQSAYNGNILIDNISNAQVATIAPSEVYLGADTTLCVGDRLVLSLEATGATYQWSDSSTNRTLEVSYPGTYWAKVTRECAEASDTIQVSFRPCEVRVPNVFTPNGDLANDTFEVKGIFPGRWQLEVYSRTGRRVYANQHYDNEWTGQDLPAGSYFYYLTDHDSSQSIKGWVELLR